MIKLITLFLTLMAANAQTISYLLPDDKSFFDHTLSTHVKKAHQEIVILTPSLNNSPFRTQLIRSIEKGIKLTLISQNPVNDELALVAYRGVELYTYHARPLADTFILIDEILVCHLAGGLNNDDLTRKTQSVMCSDEPDLIRSIRDDTIQIISRSKPYLK